MNATLIGVISSNTLMTVVWSQLFFIPSMLVGGLMMPNSILPDVAGRIARILPATHAMNAMEGLAMGFSPAFSAWISITVLLVSGVLGFALAVYLFNWDSKNRTRRGHPIMAVVVLVPYIVSMFL